MRPIRAARAAVLAFLAAFAALILFVVWRSPGLSSSTPVPRPVPSPSEELAVDGSVEAVTQTFLFTEEKGGVVVTRLSAGEMIGIEGGSRVLSDVVIELRPDPENEPDRLAQVRGETGRFDATTHEVVLQGAVDLRLATGEELHTSVLRYRLDKRVAYSDAEVQFKLEGGHGSAVGLVADLETENIEFPAQVLLQTTAEDGESTVLRAESLQRLGETEQTLLKGEVEIQGGWGVFRGNGLKIEPADDSGSVATSNAPGSLDMSVDEEADLRLEAAQWTFDIGPDNQIAAVHANGNARLRPMGTGDHAFQLLTAASIRLVPRANGEKEVVALADSNERVVALLREGPVTRIESEKLTIRQDGEAENALFEGQVRAQGPARAALGDSLLVRQDRSLLLTGLPQHPARILELSHVMDAMEIAFSNEGGGTARGGVKITVGPDPESDDQHRLAATAEEADFSADRTHFLLRGKVHTWQGEDSLEAAWLRIERNRGIATAGGGVTTSFRPGEEAGGGLRSSQRIHVRSEEVVWEQQADRAVYKGDVSMVQGPSRIQADRLYIDTGSSADRTVMAEGQVHFENQDWIGSGDKLTYLVEAATYLLESLTTLASVMDRKTGGSLRGQTLHVDAKGEAVQVEGREGGRVNVHYGAKETTP